jgi:hypothetical protein
MSVAPLLEFFKRGEVERDVRLLVAQGGLDLRALERLGILVVLLDDTDAEVRQAATSTLGGMAVEEIATILGQSDAPASLREFFAGRGVFPAEAGSGSGVEPAAVAVLEASASGAGPEADDGREPDGRREGMIQQLAKMTFPERLAAASKGSREMRAFLVRDPNKMIAAAVMSSPKLTEVEVESFARMASVSEDVLRVIAGNRVWMKNYKIASGLTRNPKTPVGLSLNLLSRLTERDLAQLAVDRNVPEPVRIAARKKVKAATTG